MARGRINNLNIGRSNTIKTSGSQQQERLTRSSTQGLRARIAAAQNSVGAARDSATSSQNSSNSYLSTDSTSTKQTARNDTRSPEFERLQTQLTNLRAQRNFARPGEKGQFATQIAEVQQQMVQETAREQGYDAPVSPATLRARNNFMTALQNVVNEAELYNQTGVYDDEASTRALIALQDSMTPEFMKLVGTQEGSDLLDQVNATTKNLTQENINFINQYTGVQNILFGDYSTELTEGTNKMSPTPELPSMINDIAPGSISSAQKNHATHLLVDYALESILGGTDVGNIYRDRSVTDIVKDIAVALREPYFTNGSGTTTFNGVSKQIYDQFADHEQVDIIGNPLAAPLDTINAMIDYVAGLPGGDITEPYPRNKFRESSILMGQALDDLYTRAETANGDEHLAISHEINKLTQARTYLAKASGLNVQIPEQRPIPGPAPDTSPEG